MRKNSIIFSFSIFCFLFLATSCTKDEVTTGLKAPIILKFSVSPSKGDKVFYSKKKHIFTLETSLSSEKINSIVWDFGDGKKFNGTRLNGKVVDHVFDKSGTYEVKVAVTNASGTTTKTLSVDVVQKKKYKVLIKSVELTKMSGKYKDETDTEVKWPGTTGENIVSPQIVIKDNSDVTIWSTNASKFLNTNVTSGLPKEWMAADFSVAPGQGELKKGELDLKGVKIYIYHVDNTSSLKKVYNSTADGNLVITSVDKAFLDGFTAGDKDEETVEAKWGTTSAATVVLQRLDVTPAE